MATSTLRQYDSTYRVWWNFCLENNISYLEAGTPEVLSFLQNQFQTKTFAYGTFNSFRSALSLILPGDVGKDPQVKRFLKGILRWRPPKRKYNFTWDPQLVLSYLERMVPNESLSLEDLTKKLVTLLALITAHRIQTLALIRVDNIVISPEKIQIHISDHIKTTTCTNVQPCLQIPFFLEKPGLCAASVLLCYIERTAEFRKNIQDFLLLTIRGPHETASTQTISRWIRQTLTKAGIDTKQFSGYSTRHAASSAAFRNGILLDTIRRTAGWTANSLVFAKFYNKPLTDSLDFANSILSKNNEI